MKTRHFALAACFALSLGVTTIHAQTIVWINPASGDWNTAANWSPATVPDSNNTAVINQPGVTVTLDSATTAGSIVLGTNSGSAVTLSLNNQTLSLFGPMTVGATGSFTVDSGALIGSSSNSV